MGVPFFMVMIMNFELLAFGDLGSIKIGLRRAEVRSTLRGGFEEFLKGPDSVVPTDAYDDFGVHVYYDESYIVVGVEFLKWSNFFWKGQRLAGEDLQLVQQFFENNGEILTFNSSGFYVNSLGLRLYAPDIGEEDAIVETVYVNLRVE